MTAPAITSTNTAVIAKCILLENTASPFVGIRRDFLVVLRINPSQAIRMPGMITSTQNMLRNTPFASTMPRSMPILKLMNTSISRPTTVVIPLETTDGKAFTTAVFMEAMISSFFARSCLNRLLRMME